MSRGQRRVRRVKGVRDTSEDAHSATQPRSLQPSAEERSEQTRPYLQLLSRSWFLQQLLEERDVRFDPDTRIKDILT